MSRNKSRSSGFSLSTSFSISCRARMAASLSITYRAPIPERSMHSDRPGTLDRRQASAYSKRGMCGWPPACKDFLRDGDGSLAVMCAAFRRGRHGPLALMGSADRGLITTSGTKSQLTFQASPDPSARPTRHHASGLASCRQHGSAFSGGSRGRQRRPVRRSPGHDGPGDPRRLVRQGDGHDEALLVSKQNLQPGVGLGGLRAHDDRQRPANQ